MNNLITARKNGDMQNSNGLRFPIWSSWIDEVTNRNLPSIFTSNFNTGFPLPKSIPEEMANGPKLKRKTIPVKSSDILLPASND
ncbi:HSP20 family protein [Arenibacter nanhaiticus]|uniref:HSP20 family protein n=1 Tax=Arenibacter nanhaiticus TaxID=558155 RepID=A0A1M6MD03_9FLAO|nr:hypothetical protein [Arenibacter nanhaiticus]SHJ81299.1 HSP20 family protein [Arenibacter nanhaiticus]